MRTKIIQALAPQEDTERSLLTELLPFLEQLPDQTPEVRKWRERLDDFLKSHQPL